MPSVKSCTRVERGTCVPPMIQFVALERVRLRIRSSRKNLKLVDEEPTPVMPNETENLVKETSARF